MTTLTREQLRQRIDLLEALDGLMSAVDDMSGAELNHGELVDLQISDRTQKESPVAFAHGLPPEIVLAGLQAMRAKLEEQLA